MKEDNLVSIRNRNTQALITEIFKVKNNIAPEIMEELLTSKISPYDICNNNSFKRRRVNSAWHDTESMSYLGPKKWDLVPDEIKESESLNSFKFKIKTWVPDGCPCRTFKIYLVQIGVCNNIKKLVFSEIKLCAITIISLYKSSIIFN